MDWNGMTEIKVWALVLLTCLLAYCPMITFMWAVELKRVSILLKKRKDQP